MDKIDITEDTLEGTSGTELCKELIEKINEIIDWINSQ